MHTVVRRVGVPVPEWPPALRTRAAVFGEGVEGCLRRPRTVRQDADDPARGEVIVAFRVVGGRQVPVRERVHECRLHPAGLVVAQQVQDVAGLAILVALQLGGELRGPAVIVVRHRLRRARDVGCAAERAAAELGRGARLALPRRGRQGLRERCGVGRVAVPGVA
ncbi:hypothetical protein ABNF97_29085 [Plantactinospora sp. B6F1]|uniref:hypothetical protein n=1 Tax=Plantactinospora sp. B6F1 TaxID=3158971 RepID=UPI0032D94079